MGIEREKLLSQPQENETLENKIDSAEKIGVVGSPSSTSKLNVDVLATAVEKRLIGTMTVMKFMQEGVWNYALGQITEIKLINQFAQDPTMKGLIRERGSVDPITGKQDTHLAELLISAVFEENSNQITSSSFATVPATGTSIRVVNQEIMDKLVPPQAEQTSYIGKIYGNDVLLPTVFRHFGFDDGGLGEAMHIGIFGKTGSGKSFLAKMILMAYLRHKSMSIVVLDPRGEFSKLAIDDDVKNYVEKELGREIQVYDLHNLLLLEDWELFKKILLKSKFVRRLGVRLELNQEEAADVIEDILRNHRFGNSDIASIVGGLPIDRIHTRNAFNHLWNRMQHQDTDDDGHTIYPAIDQFYNPGHPHARVRNTMANANMDEWYNMWRGITNLFGRDGSGFHHLDNILASIGKEGKGKLVIINLSDTSKPDGLYWSADIQKSVINQILENIKDTSQKLYDQEKEPLNALVILDEAHLFAPRRIEDDEKDEAKILRGTLRNALRETRKFHLGWMLISQTLSSIDRGIIEQLRMMFMGFGLAYGLELVGLRELLSGNEAAINLYQQFQDPNSVTINKKYSFMGIGPSSPLSVSQVPIFFNSLSFPKEFLEKNKIEAGGQTEPDSE